MTSVFVRIALRWVSGYLVIHGILGQEDASAIFTDPDFAMLLEPAIGFVIGAATEGWYALAKKFGWAT